MPYLFPKTQHVRQLRPKRQFKNYRCNKPILRVEFARICVYCRQPDCQAAGQVFGVDHYKPKKHFPSEARLYENLFYCCNKCNALKSDYWPRKGELSVLNPCDDVMADHVRFDKKTGRMEPTSLRGKFFEDTFRLNEEDAAVCRIRALQIIEMASVEKAKYSKLLTKIRAALAGAKDGQEVERLQAKESSTLQGIAGLQDIIDRQSGSLPLKPLSPRLCE